MYYRQISGNGIDFGFPFGSTYTLAFSRMLYGHEVLVAYNVSGQQRSDGVLIDATLHGGPNAALQFLYGGQGSVPVQTAPNQARYVQLNLAPHAFVILE